ncbi:unnamed protein product [Prunus armeniaca]|uniref:Endonuclease/exonuclease/phosphatase domain-containing protein n=1 Tax=Prunus armeniaca TaxID=36596 RepID=A0A6J5TZH0_PRUAR|nr:unnamed protein product [Prunus armeniaca]CAB4298747.1 unnamed protein product [Prunus armeniaca]
MIGMGNEQVTGTQGSNPFNLGPIIEKTMHRSAHGKNQRKNKRDYAETIRGMESATDSKSMPIPIMHGNDRKKARRCLSGGDRPKRVSTSAMKILVWNCQGIGGNLTVSSLKEQVKLHIPDMVLLLETKTRSQRYGFLKKFWLRMMRRGMPGASLGSMQAQMIKFGRPSGLLFKLGLNGVQRLV